jgi:hypothetical protein
MFASPAVTDRQAGGEGCRWAGLATTRIPRMNPFFSLFFDCNLSFLRENALWLDVYYDADSKS